MFVQVYIGESPEPPETGGGAPGGPGPGAEGRPAGVGTAGRQVGHQSAGGGGQGGASGARQDDWLACSSIKEIESRDIILF